MDDVAEAIAIGGRIGRRVVVIGTLTGGTLAAWAQFGSTTGPAAPSGEVMNFQAYQGMLAGLGPERAAQQVQRLVQGGVSFRVSTPAEARQLPSGTPIILPDGTQGRVP